MLFEALQKESLAGDQDLDLDDITSAGPTRCPTATPNQKSKPPENPPPVGGLSLNQLQEKANQVITYEWVRYKKGLNVTPVCLIKQEVTSCISCMIDE